MSQISVSRVIHDLQEAYPLEAGDEGHFLCMVVLEDGTFKSVHGLLSRGTLKDFRARIMTPAAMQLEYMLEKSASAQGDGAGE